MVRVEGSKRGIFRKSRGLARKGLEWLRAFEGVEVGEVDRLVGCQEGAPQHLTPPGALVGPQLVGPGALLEAQGQSLRDLTADDLKLLLS